MPGLASVLLCGVTGGDSENQIRSLLRLAGCDEHYARVILQRFQPVRQICRTVIDGAVSDATVPRKKCGAHLGNQFLATVVLVSESFEVRQGRTIQSGRMPCAVGELMEQR
jgi:hypothetical protein